MELAIQLGIIMIGHHHDRQTSGNQCAGDHVAVSFPSTGVKASRNECVEKSWLCTNAGACRFRRRSRAHVGKMISNELHLVVYSKNISKWVRREERRLSRSSISFSFTIRFHHDLRRCLSHRSALRPAEQLDRNSSRRAQTRLRDEVRFLLLFSPFLLRFCFSLAFRRPIAFRSSTIGIWFEILQVLAYLAIVANVRH